jgi:hypothetical protein
MVDRVVVCGFSALSADDFMPDEALNQRNILSHW